MIGNAREDTLSDSGAMERWANAFRRGAQCPVDVMGTVDLFAHKDVPLVEARARFGERSSVCRVAVRENFARPKSRIFT